MNEILFILTVLIFVGVVYIAYQNEKFKREYTERKEFDQRTFNQFRGKR